jgi:hypothetical protein
MLLVDVGLFFIEGEGFYFSAVHTYGACAEVEAHTIRIHEWCANDAVVTINIDKIKVDIVFDLA